MLEGIQGLKYWLMGVFKMGEEEFYFNVRTNVTGYYVESNVPYGLIRDYFPGDFNKFLRELLEATNKAKLEKVEVRSWFRDGRDHELKVKQMHRERLRNLVARLNESAEGQAKFTSR